VRRFALIAAGLALTVVLAACGSQGVRSATPAQCTPKPNCGVAAQSGGTIPALQLTGDPTSGKTIFSNCTGCHTLAAAGASGTAGPNLDQLKPSFETVATQVWNGGGIMPAYGKSGQFTPQQVADVAAYVVQSTGGTLP
jgi:mono/diheme cytochrome c family protein